MTALLTFFISFMSLFSTPVFAATTTSYNVDPYPFTSTIDAERFATLTKEIRCVVCQHQSIADSNAPLAEGLRQKVYHMILDHRSDADIKDYMVKRYGDFILLQPRMNKVTAALWIAPFLLLGIGGLVLLRFLWARQKR